MNTEIYISGLNQAVIKMSIIRYLLEINMEVHIWEKGTSEGSISIHKHQRFKVFMQRVPMLPFIS